MSDYVKFLLAALVLIILTYLSSFVSSIFDSLMTYKEKPPAITAYPGQYDVLKGCELKEEKVLVKPERETIIFECTAYDLSVQSCGKLPSHPAYGITANGTSLRGKTREMAMAIAVDPNVIPMGSNVYLEFDGPRSKYNGVYTAVDTGSAIKGRRIDVFFGDTANTVCQEALEFGRANARVTLL